MTQITLYHNPRCSKSRAALALLEEQGVNPELKLYMDTPPTVAELRRLLDSLGMEARELLRTSEPLCREQRLDNPGLPQKLVLAAMSAEPCLIQRPIAVRGARAVLGRPPEKVLELLP